MQVALFITCFNDTLFPNVGIATTQLLERLGHIVAFPEAQTCCGQMHFNTGYKRESVPLVRHFVEVFRDPERTMRPEVISTTISAIWRTKGVPALHAPESWVPCTCFLPI